MVSGETPKDLLRAEPRSSPFEVSGVLALHGGGGGGGSGVGRMGGSENRGGVLPGPGQSTLKAEAVTVPRPARRGGGRRRHSGYHGEAAGSSHSSWAPKHWSSRDPPRADRAGLSSRRMRSRDSYSLRRLSLRPWFLRQI